MERLLSQHELFRFSVFVVLGYQTLLFSLLSRFSIRRVSCAWPECRGVHNADEVVI